MKTNREVQRVITAHHQREGAGFVVRRPLPTPGLEVADHFLLIDELGPVDYRPGEAIGAPDHPHRGFETVSYILEGEVEHEDSAGHRGSIGPGAVQWMTAGAGIVHSEEPSARLREQGGRMHGFQIWVNLPARLKLTRPRYQEVPAARIPRASEGGATVRLIAGEALGQRAVIDTHTPIAFHDWTLEPNAEVTVPLPEAMSAMVYVFHGAASVSGKRLDEGQLGLLGAGAGVALRGGDGGARLLLLAGEPHREPVARYGPFVMNTRQQLLEAFEDYESGRMGQITRTAEVR